MWSVECGVWSVECGDVRSVKCCAGDVVVLVILLRW